MSSAPGQSDSVDALLSVVLNSSSNVPMKKTRIAGWTDRMGNDLFSSVFACYKEAAGADPTFSEDSETRAVVSEIGELLLKSKRIAKHLKTSSDASISPHASASCVLPARHIADATVEVYVESFESTHRILHIPTFRNDYERYYAGETIPEEVLLSLLLVIAIGSSLSDEQSQGEVSRTQAGQWIHAAQTWLSGPFDKGRLSIAALQLHCLTLLARQVLCVGGDLIWISVGSLLNQAVYMGLHRDPSRIKGLSRLQVELRRRLWGTILDLMLQSSLDRALPPSIYLNDCDTEPPSNVDDNELGNSEQAGKTRRADRFTDATIQRLLLQSLPLRLRVVQLLNGLKPTLHYPEVLDLSQQLVSACQTSSSELKRHGASQFRCNLLDYLQRRFLLPLHCLFANQSRSQPLYFYSLKVSLDASSLIAAPPPDTRWSRLMSVAGGMFREGIRYASITMGIEALAQAQIPQEGPPCGVIDGKLCKKLMQSLFDSSVERIRHGETNVKNPMFLSMVMTQAKAMEEGKPTRLIMAQAARDSLRECYEILETRKTGLSLAGLPYVVNQSAGTSSFGEIDDFDLGFDLDFFMPDLVL